jgi:hypothetical protein
MSVEGLKLASQTNGLKGYRATPVALSKMNVQAETS